MAGQAPKGRWSFGCGKEDRRSERSPAEPRRSSARPGASKPAEGAALSSRLRGESQHAPKSDAEARLETEPSEYPRCGFQLRGVSRTASHHIRTPFARDESFVAGSQSLPGREHSCQGVSEFGTHLAGDRVTTRGARQLGEHRQGFLPNLLSSLARFRAGLLGRAAVSPYNTDSLPLPLYSHPIWFFLPLCSLLQDVRQIRDLGVKGGRGRAGAAWLGLPRLSGSDPCIFQR